MDNKDEDKEFMTLQEFIKTYEGSFNQRELTQLYQMGFYDSYAEFKKDYPKVKEIKD